MGLEKDHKIIGTKVSGRSLHRKFVKKIKITSSDLTDSVITASNIRGLVACDNTIESLVATCIKLSHFIIDDDCEISKSHFTDVRFYQSGGIFNSGFHTNIFNRTLFHNIHFIDSAFRDNAFIDCIFSQCAFDSSIFVKNTFCGTLFYRNVFNKIRESTSNASFYECDFWPATTLGEFGSIKEKYGTVGYQLVTKNMRVGNVNLELSNCKSVHKFVELGCVPEGTHMINFDYKNADQVRRGGVTPRSNNVMSGTCNTTPATKDTQPIMVNRPVQKNRFRPTVFASEGLM